ncbi:DNA replication ATP-dependent helicase/nuclease DNA2 isoform X2 [Venturia canescens]|uniref:DNA replication ATP-dependent helicase/nuclease DNA2 isoform X2 n=1 Tax=Venturia canescens TaxID=32260 RepID=UPI001C9BF752|nr:DNA replication ATP-dependent helicase/nuclease DNA2 isoform X2 [Venturia canescens]
MNENQHKQFNDEPVDHEENNEHCQSLKRLREESPEGQTSQALRRIRKKPLQHSSNVEKKENDFHGEFTPDNVKPLHKKNDKNHKHTDGKPTSQNQQETQILVNETNGIVTQDSAVELEFELDSQMDDFFDEDFSDETKAVNLEEFRRCKIVKVEREKRYTKLVVKDCVEQTTANVLCYGFWKDASVEENDVVSIKAKKDSHDWKIDNENGVLVVKPYFLISGTTITSANFCTRRSILAEYFRGLDSLPNLEIDDCGMTVGTLTHEVLQTVLSKKLTSINEIQNVIDEILGTRRTIRMLYEAGLSLKKCKEQMEAYIPKIVDFVRRYITGIVEEVHKDDFNGKIEHVREIEENVWLPELGIKGKIDATVEVKINDRRRIMPLEIKTGRPSFSNEHRGQLILYCMMLKLLGQETDAGLLLYIRENIMQEIQSNRPEERDLILLRNILVHYFSQAPANETTENGNHEAEQFFKPMKLPEPINYRNACIKCPYNVICCVYADKDKSLELPESHVLKTIFKEAMDCLEPQHIDYIMNWITMLRLESGSGYLGAMKNIWILEPLKREQKGTCISNLDVCGDAMEIGRGYLHTFVRKNYDGEYAVSDLNEAPFSEGDYLIVSTDTRINVSAGHLQQKSKHAIEVLLDRDIVRQNPGATFHLDKYPEAGSSSRNLSNVACLLNNNEITNKLRGIIIDKKPATFVEKLPKSLAQVGAPLLYNLNKYQRKAVLSVFSANDYVLIKGMPGTGKTRTLVALIEVLVKMGQSVLITSHTHSAVDNILLKLEKNGVDFLRLGSDLRINASLLHKSENILAAQCTTPESLEAMYLSKKVVAVTCLGSTHSHVARRIFDVCLIDESTQVLQPTVLRPIYSASKFVLVGDPEQLPPIIRNDEARKMGMNESLFARLDSENNTVTLKLQYRMNKRIMSIANILTYNDSMIAANSQIANATLYVKDPTVLESCEQWVSKVLSLYLEDSAVILNTGATHSLNIENPIAECRDDEKLVSNVFEAAIILRLISVLRKGGVEPSAMGIICPFTAQVQLLRSLSEDIEVNTVDQYQGRDKDVIFYSCTRSVSKNFKEPKGYSILEDSPRLNVAVTRAKHKLIIIGDKSSLKVFKPFQQLFQVMENDIVDLEPGQDQFTWESLMQSIK